MKVTVTLVLDVDPQAWITTYGTDSTRAADIRGQVKEYIANAAQNLAAVEEGAILEVTLRR